MKKIFDIDKIAKENWYSDMIELLSDYGFVPIVLIPKHKQWEIISLGLKPIKSINKHLSNKNNWRGRI